MTFLKRLIGQDVTNSTSSQIINICDKVKFLLLEKNRKYGDSAVNPVRVFSKADSVEQIKVRIDDKLSRLKNQQGDEDEDVILDLIGYLILLRIAQLKQATIKDRVSDKTPWIYPPLTRLITSAKIALACRIAK